MQPFLISVSQTGELLGLGRTKVYELMNSGRLKSARIGGRRLVDFASAERFACESLNGLVEGRSA